MQLVFFLEQVLNGLLVGAYYLLIALGLSLIFSLGGVVNLAHGGFYAIGAYLAVLLTPRIGFARRVFRLAAGSSASSGSWSSGCSFAASIAPIRSSACCSPSASPWSSSRALRMIFGAAPLPFSIPPELRGQVFIGDFIYSRYRLIILAVALAAVTATWFIVYRTAFGRVVRAGVQNPDMVGALGISLAALHDSRRRARDRARRACRRVAGADFGRSSGDGRRDSHRRLRRGRDRRPWFVLGRDRWRPLLVGVVRGITIYFYPPAGEASIYLLMALVLLSGRGAFSASASRSSSDQDAHGTPSPLIVAAAGLAVLPVALDAVGLPLASSIDVVVFAIAVLASTCSSANRARLVRSWRLVRARRIRGGSDPAHWFPGIIVLPVLFALSSSRVVGALVWRPDPAPARRLFLAADAGAHGVTLRRSRTAGLISPAAKAVSAASCARSFLAPISAPIASITGSPPAIGFMVASCCGASTARRSAACWLRSARTRSARASIGYSTSRYKLLGFVVSATRGRRGGRAVGVQPSLCVGRAARRRLLGRAGGNGGDRRHAQLPRAGARRVVLHPLPRVPVDLDARTGCSFSGCCSSASSCSRRPGSSASPSGSWRRSGRGSSKRPQWRRAAPRLPSRCRISRSQRAHVEGPILVARGTRKSFGGIRAGRACRSVRRATAPCMLSSARTAPARRRPSMSCPGSFPPDSGDVRWLAIDRRPRRPAQIVQAGIGRSFQITNLFPALSVEENLRLAVQASHPRRFDPWTAARSDRRSSSRRPRR